MKFDPLPTPDEPKCSLDELVRSYGSAGVLRALARTMRDRSREQSDQATRRSLRQAARKCLATADLLDTSEVEA
jgi:hypothetical protein